MSNFEQKISTALINKRDYNKQSNLQILKETGRKIYIIGKNAESFEFAMRYKVDGIIDDYNNSSERWHGLSITKKNDIPKDSIVINCATSICPVQVTRNLKAAGLNNVLQVADLISENGEILPLPWFVSQQRAETKQYASWWCELYEMMSDKISKQVLLDVLRFRLTANPEYMTEYEVRLNDQYFEEFMGYTDEVFVDAGGYNGDTTEEFINRYPNYKKVYLFEPSQKNLSTARQRLSGRRDIHFRSVGLSDVSGTLSFNADAGSASAVTTGFGESISVVTLDEELSNETISFIKMDLEGWEMNALRGAENTIKNCKPKLAIAVYHSAKDFREVPQYLLNLNPNYKIYLRHYTQGWSETIMYFI